MFGHSDLERAVAVVREAMPPTPQLAWPLVARRVGAEGMGQA